MISTIIILLSLSAIVALRQERLQRNKSEIQHHYLQMLLVGNNQSERYIEELSQLSGIKSKQAAAEVIAELSHIIYRLDAQALENITHSLHLTDFLLQQTSRSRGIERTKWLAIFSRVPLSDFDTKELLPYLRSKNRMESFYALMALINADQRNVMHHVAQYPTTMTQFEISQLLSLLRQGSIAVAFQPMLQSKNVNLNLLGVAVVQHFGVESAQGKLREIIASHHNFTLRLESLYALCSMQLMLCSPSIKEFVSRMPRIETRRFLRHIALEGYAQSVINFFTRKSERKYFNSLINSYKIKIECF
ncbi:MAG: hypothetical protein SNG49_06610 [Rikenellaceae bacterium]